MHVDVYLWWIGTASAAPGLLGELHAQTERAFEVSVRTWHGHERPSGSYDPRRRQHSSNYILKWLLETRPRHGSKIVGITDVDLFIPILTFVYGEAQLGGAAAVVSTARLTPSDGFFADPGQLRDRAVKETIHEIGHTFGLVHCPRPECVMSRSVNLVQVDAKAAALCHDCRIRFGELRQQGRKHHE